MKRTFLFLLLMLVSSFGVWAHPLGNFSVNQYSRLEVEKSQIKIRYVLDLAEVPTFQERAVIDADRDGSFSEAELRSYAERITPQILANMFLAVNGRPLVIRAVSSAEQLEEGAGNLPTLKIKWNLAADSEAANGVNQVKFENKNYLQRLGWNEIVVARARGISVFDSNAFGSGVTNELQAYPQETLEAPLAERSAAFSFATNAAAAGAIPLDAKPLQDRDGHITAATAPKDRLAELIAVPEITPSIIIFGLFLAFGLGAMHALSPGHGKTVVGAYLIGSRGTPLHAVFLGLTVTITHTLGVFALGLVTLFASNFILPETLMPFLSFVSGLLVFFIGVSLFKDRLFSILSPRTHSGHHHHHEHDHAHHVHDRHAHDEHHHHHDGFTHTHDGHTHSHLPPGEISWKSLLVLGISGGLLPCPSALVLMLSAISLGRTGYGLILTTVFSLGLSATLTTVGLMFLYAGRAFGNSQLAESRLIKTVPVFSAFVIACIGAVICYQSLT